MWTPDYAQARGGAQSREVVASAMPPVFVMLPFETVRRILHFTEGGQATPAEGRRESPAPGSDAKRFPPLRLSVVDALKGAEFGRHAERAEYDVMLERDGAAALRGWCLDMCRHVEKPLVNDADRRLLRDAVSRIDAVLNSTT